jgi:tRNA-splicing ligase RtcB
VGTFYHRQALELNKMFLSPLPDPALAFIPVGVPLFDMYMAEMRWSMKYSELNRQHITSEAYNAFCVAADWPVSILESYETHHNYVQIENHFGHNYFIHRKGAVRAFGTVIIPGSMGTASYIAKGLHASQSFHSCSHGAGRVMSRTQANKTITAKEAHIAMQNVVYDIREGQYDEMPMAYKDIDAVITAQTALVEPLHRLTPLAVLKG